MNILTQGSEGNPFHHHCSAAVISFWNHWKFNTTKGHFPLFLLFFTWAIPNPGKPPLYSWIEETDSRWVFQSMIPMIAHYTWKLIVLLVKFHRLINWDYVLWKTCEAFFYTIRIKILSELDLKSVVTYCKTDPLTCVTRMKKTIFWHMLNWLGYHKNVNAVHQNQRCYTKFSQIWDLRLIVIQYAEDTLFNCIMSASLKENIYRNKFII